MPEFFQKLPHVIRKKNQFLIDKISSYVKSEARAKKRIEAIINNNQFLATKMEQLWKLKEEFDKEAQKKQYKLDFDESMGNI